MTVIDELDKYGKDHLLEHLKASGKTIKEIEKLLNDIPDSHPDKTFLIQKFNSSLKFYIWTRWPNDHGWVMQSLVYSSIESAAPEKLLFQMSGYAVKILAEGERP